VSSSSKLCKSRLEIAHKTSGLLLLILDEGELSRSYATETGRLLGSLELDRGR